MCRTLLLCILSAVSNIALAQATTRVAEVSLQDDPEVYCEIRGRFVEARPASRDVLFRGRTQRSARVHWVFAVESATPVPPAQCPGGSEFSLTIRGADQVTDRDTGEQRFVYPVDVTPPERGDRVRLRVRRNIATDPRDGAQIDEWLFTNLESGYVREP